MSGLSIVATTRTDSGKAEVRRLRKTGQMPAVVYGGEEAPVSIQIRHDEMLHSLEDEEFYSSILTLDVDGKEEEVILRAVERHPAKIIIMHADFKRVVRGQEMTMSVPVHYINADEAVGVKAGGILDVMFNEFEISCLPRNLPKAIEVDVAAMEIGDSISLSKVSLPEGVSLVLFSGMSDEEIESHDQAIVALHEPKAVVEEEPEVVAEGEEGEAAEGAGDAEASADDADKAE